MEKMYFGGFEGFTLINGILTPIKVKSIRLFANGTIMYKTNKGELFDIIMYASREDFEKGTEQSIEISFGCYMPKLSTDEDGNEVLRYNLWRMESGEPIECEVAVQYDIDTNGRAELIIPEGHYLTRQDCLNYETYQYEDEDGNTVSVDGLGKRLQLTQEQTDFLDNELAPALKKAKEMGIGLVLDYYWGVLRAYNATRTSGLTIDYKYDVDDDNVVSSEKFYQFKDTDICFEGDGYVYHES